MIRSRVLAFCLYSFSFVLLATQPHAAQHESSVTTMQPPSNEVTFRLALKNLDLGLIRVLLERGVDPNTADQDGATALAVAAHMEDYALVDYLLTLPSIDVNTQDIYGITPLMHAIEQGDQNIATITRIIDHPKSDINAFDKDGRTVLMYALAYLTDDICYHIIEKEQLHSYSYVEIAVTKLLNRNALVWPETIDGHTALDFADYHTSDDLKDLLEKQFETTDPNKPRINTKGIRKQKRALIRTINDLNGWTGKMLEPSTTDFLS